MPRKPWSGARAIATVERKRGRAGQRERARILAEEPFCRHCLRSGREVIATVIDHIKPLAWGGSDERANKQPLCGPCHDMKSKAERSEAGRWAR